MSDKREISICVFCGASAGDATFFTEVGYQLGKQLGLRGHRLIYGAGGVGVMGAVAQGAAENGGSIVGIIPAFLREREIKDRIPFQDVVIAESLAQRKSTMISLADGFVVLPGGYGTLDEMIEVISMKALEIEGKPIILVNTQGFWDPFIDLIDYLARRRFLSESKHFMVADEPAEAIDHIEFAVATGSAAGPPPMMTAQHAGGTDVSDVLMSRVPSKSYSGFGWPLPL